ncbi:probable galactinol--sucrose galactosyltransferase 6 isoform X2 [Amborella trichopoda]|uniref:probable galactinol--sucrose galactosyltransferase 6 isoform X2 n=1 Tax=Amborella trichopoda TaxID=13333 RepID=UPI0009BEA548|nr:probable galactinol--sucrose galactosyltransferase 6 isoform X2 [Amborella trichopoda]|eukprot:XP_020528371.1 probable galactinol--sucrose galactosyltransferase 6 isoform X2 [Amborella trichopoda]
MWRGSFSWGGHGRGRQSGCYPHWTFERTGDYGKDVPKETQFLLLKAPSSKDGSSNSYIFLLPLLDGSFRACLQGGENDELQLYMDSGDPAITASSWSHALIIKSGEDPFKLIEESIMAAESHLQTFLHRKKKKLPSIIDWFGWCTWDAFYTEVSAKGVEEGLKSLCEGGIPPRFLIIDDGWQSVATDETSNQPSDNIPLGRLTQIKENKKFQKHAEANGSPKEPTEGIQHIVKIAKEMYNVKYVYVWHALAGYWGGVKPNVEGTEGYDAKLQYPLATPASFARMAEIEWLSTEGLGLVHPSKAAKFFDELHAYLAASGIDGVKVDVQSVLETVASNMGGRIGLAALYHRALDASIARNFKENGIIACMSHSADALFFSKQTAIVRASDDFYPRNPLSHSIHVAAVSYNSVFLGEFMQPDWDMFHSLHSASEYHGAARAIGGCPVYVSDKPGEHDFDLLKKLVLPDGRVLRALLPGRPTLDCLFVDPTRDGKSLLKIWNMNKYTGVLGVFNCQGAAWDFGEKKNMNNNADKDMNSMALEGRVCGGDVHLLREAAVGEWSGYCAIYSHRGLLVCLPVTSGLSLKLKVLEYEVYTVTPIQRLGAGVYFAPVGLIHMFNSGGAIRKLEYRATSMENGDIGGGHVLVSVMGSGQFGAYASTKPKACWIDYVQSDFTYDENSGLLTLHMKQNPNGLTWDISIDF